VAGEIDLIHMISTRYVSAGTQRVETRQVLPLPLPEEDEEETEQPGQGARLEGYTEFEPEPEKLLAELAPRALEAEIFAALLEGSAAFFTAQQRAMAAATDNADELVRTLTRVMNRARQDSITTEIMEIVGGAEALRQAKGA
jgi:F-type H+-transporting ATPase subunit gamma